MGKKWRQYAVGRYRLGILNGIAVVRWTDAQGAHRRRLGRLSEVEARAELDAFARRVHVLKTESSATVGQVFEAYTDDRKRDGKLIKAFLWNWKALRGRFANLPVDAVNADICRDYARDRRDAGIKPGTIWTELTRLRSCLNWATKRRMIDRAPYVWVPSKPPPRNIVLTEAEVGALIDACIEPHVRLFVILAITTAARSGAIVALTWDRVDLEAGRIDFREPEVVDPLTKRVRKSRSVVPITPEARAALQTARDGALSPYVIEWAGQRVQKIRKGFSMAVARAGLPSTVTPHVLRHTAASWLESEGIGMERIARLLGHRDPATTRTIYAKPDVESLRPSANIIDMKIRKGTKR